MKPPRTLIPHWIILLVAAYEIIGAYVLITDPLNADVATMRLFKALNIPMQMVGLMFLVAGICACFAPFVRSLKVFLALTVAQQIVLFLVGGGSLMCILTSTYSDGVPRPPNFILLDQALYVAMMMLHLFAMLDCMMNSAVRNLERTPNASS